MVLTDTITAQCTSAAMYHSLLTLSHSLSHQTGQKKQKGQTEPGLVALYDIRLRNGAGLFLHPGTRMGPDMPMILMYSVL